MILKAIGSDQTISRHSIPFAYIAAAIALALSLIGASLALYLTRDGAGATGDSAWYLMGAQNLLAGNGFARTSGGGELRAISHFPPVYSGLIAAISATGITPIDGARYLNLLLFAANILLVGFLIFKVTRSMVAMILGALLIMASVSLIEIHSWIMSEPLYIFLSLAIVHLLALGISSGRRGIIMAASVLTAAAIMTRYAGFSMLAAGAVCIAVLGSRSLGWRLVSAVSFSLPALVPSLWFVASQTSQTGSIANRQIRLHSINPSLVATFQAELIAWVFAKQLPVPWRPRAILAAIVALLGPAYLFYSHIRRDGIRRPKADNYEQLLPWILGTFLLAYPGLIMANSFLLDAATTLDAPERYLAPAYVLLVILSVVTTYELVRRVSWKRIPAAFAISLGVLLLAFHARQSLRLVDESGLNLGYVIIRRDMLELMDGLASLDPDLPIISNNPEALYIAAGRTAYLLPIRNDVITQRERTDYEQNIEANRRRLDSGGVLVIFGTPDEAAQEAMNDLDVTLLRGFGSAMFYKASEN